MLNALRTPSSIDSTLVALLGGKSVLKGRPTSALDWVEAIRVGLPVAVVDAVLKATQLSHADLAQGLRITERTLARRKRQGVLNKEESAKLVRLARIVARGTEVFESVELGIDWLKAPNPSVRRHAPLSLLDTDIGAEIVLEILGRIEHGVFS